MEITVHGFIVHGWTLYSTSMISFASAPKSYKKSAVHLKQFCLCLFPYICWNGFCSPQPKVGPKKSCWKNPQPEPSHRLPSKPTPSLTWGFQERWRKGSLTLIHPVVTETTSESSGEDPTGPGYSTPLGGVKIHKLFFLELRYQFTSSQVTCHAFRFAESSGHSRKSPPPSMGNTSRHAGKIQPVMCTSPTIAYASANIFQKSGHFPISYKYHLSSTKNFHDVTTSFNGHVNEYDIEKRLCVTIFWPL